MHISKSSGRVSMFGTVARFHCKLGGQEWVRAWMDVQTKRDMVG